MVTKTKKKSIQSKNSNTKTIKSFSKPKSSLKYPKVCSKNMTFGECELALLRKSVDKAEHNIGYNIVNDDEIQKIIQIMESFLVDKKLVCYGGTAINNLLPLVDRFYNLNIQLPDYDAYSSNALKDAIELADLYYKKGYREIEAKAGMHPGTYKVFVNFIPIADLTQIPQELFKTLVKKSKSVNKILYAPVNFLRMSMYLELSRPKGDIGRWEKVMKRLTLLNKNYPVKGENCDKVDIQRVFTPKNDNNDGEKIFKIARDTFVNLGVVFFGATANHLYSQYYKKNNNKTLKKIPDFDIIAENYMDCAENLKKNLIENGYTNITFKKHKGLSEIIPYHVEVRVKDDTIAIIYNAMHCHSYNSVIINNRNMKIASIDTMLSFYLSFLYLDRDYYNKDRLLCMSELLFKVQQRNRLKQRGILRRFSINCYGEPVTITDIRKEKNIKYKKLKNKKGTKKFIKEFLRYIPGTPKGKLTKKNLKIKQNKKSRKNKK